MIHNLALVNVKTILPSLPSHFPPLPPSSPFTIHHLSLPPPPTSIPLRRKSDITKSSTYASQPRNFSVQCRHHVGVDLSAHQYYWLLANTIICMCLLWYYRFKWICKNWIVSLSRSRSRSSETALRASPPNPPYLFSLSYCIGEQGTNPPICFCLGKSPHPPPPLLFLKH